MLLTCYLLLLGPAISEVQTRFTWPSLTLSMRICDYRVDERSTNLFVAAQTAAHRFKKYVRHTIVPADCTDVCVGFCGVLYFQKTHHAPAYTQSFVNDNVLMSVNVFINDEYEFSQATLNNLVVHEYLHVYGLAHLPQTTSEDSMLNYALTRDGNGGFYQEVNSYSLTSADIRDLRGGDMADFEAPRSLEEQQHLLCY